MTKSSLSDNRFDNIGYESFRQMAQDDSLSRYEKVGFPDTYRSGQEALILADWLRKLPALDQGGARVLDIGCGCSDLPRFLMERAAEKSQHIILLDSREMLDQLPAAPVAEKIAARYPDCPDLFARHAGRIDVILVYSVIQYVFAEGNIFDFLDRSLGLLAPNGHMLIGDIPNSSMRKRFFASETGMEHHRAFTGTDECPVVDFNQPEPGKIDDAVVFALAMRARAAGFHAFVVPQSADLPMANRREDLLIVRP